MNFSEITQNSDISWYNVISNNFSYCLEMLYVTEINTFPCQLHQQELSRDL